MYEISNLEVKTVNKKYKKFDQEFEIHLQSDSIVRLVEAEPDDLAVPYSFKSLAEILKMPRDTMIGKLDTHT